MSQVQERIKQLGLKKTISVNGLRRKRKNTYRKKKRLEAEKPKEPQVKPTESDEDIPELVFDEPNVRSVEEDVFDEPSGVEEIPSFEEQSEVVVL